MQLDASSPQVAFGEAVRRERQLRSESQEELAFRCGLHRTYIGSLERGERNVSLENIVRLANAFELRASELLSRAGL